ncbi:MAG: hypothetical protein LBE12_01875 [Planctomycetaceae bacterium]|nr:hypothetical protein [Planctomycetaceae bacterium]
MSTIPKRIYGIDLGTTYSAITFINEHGKAEIIRLWNYSYGRLAGRYFFHWELR